MKYTKPDGKIVIMRAGNAPIQWGNDYEPIAREEFQKLELDKL